MLWALSPQTRHPTIDTRLKTVADAIAAVASPNWRFCDIGSDHAYLLKALLHDGIVERGIAIENKTLPLRNSTQALRGLRADVRFGDGLEPVAANECDAMSICGMGGQSMIAILERFPERVPEWIFLQPNKDMERLREWAFDQGFLVQEEFLTSKLFTILVYRAGPRSSPRQTTQASGHEIVSELPTNELPSNELASNELAMERTARPTTGTVADPAYESLDREAAFLFGPLLLRRRDARLFARLREEQIYLQNLERRTARSQARYDAIRRVLNASMIDPKK